MFIDNQTIIPFNIESFTVTGVDSHDRVPSKDHCTYVKDREFYRNHIRPTTQPATLTVTIIGVSGKEYSETTTYPLSITSTTKLVADKIQELTNLTSHKGLQL